VERPGKRVAGRRGRPGLVLRDVGGRGADECKSGFIIDRRLQGFRGAGRDAWSSIVGGRRAAQGTGGRRSLRRGVLLRPLPVPGTAERSGIL